MPVVIFVAFVKVMILLKHYLLLIWLTIMRVKEYHGWCDGYGIISGLPSRANIQWRQWIWLCRVGWTGKFLISLLRYRYRYQIYVIISDYIMAKLPNKYDNIIDLYISFYSISFHFFFY